MESHRAASELGPSFTSLAEALRAGRNVEDIYQSIVESAVRVIKGCDHASVMMLENGQFKTVAASDDIARQVDRLERETGEGPCLDAIIAEAFQHDTDLTVDPSWPSLAKRCLAETPVRSMVAFRLVSDGRKVGALNVFADVPGALDQFSIDEAAVLAAFASVAVSAASERSRADNLMVALDSNREIGKAIGLLMASHKLTDQQAFDVLKRASQDLNRKLHDIATEFVAKETAGLDAGNGG